jgi:hypothetical protein
MSKSIKQLEAERAALLHQLADSADMRRGSITEVYRRCGKPNCACAESGHRGHGPYYAYTMSVGGKTRTVQLRAGPRLSAIEREVAEYKRFRATSERVIDVNEQICNARWLETSEAQSKKKRR